MMSPRGKGAKNPVQKPVLGTNKIWFLQKTEHSIRFQPCLKPQTVHTKKVNCNQIVIKSNRKSLKVVSL
jgi:hypothetical protein